jgi:molybdopterin converting factor small subunit
MIAVQVKLYGNLRQYRPNTADGAPHHPFSVALDESAKMKDLLAVLAIPEGLTAVFALDGDSADANTLLTNDAKVSLFPPTAGGTFV